ncbi:MAG: hypothetical protein KZQ95_02105 [Candidatus Thiodiazotropha sp. (ex Epidulcina cf. delphinae)]|nr:hypothetical protein [Candidatus Thiodiazotropha sp. (ex Epidulcina cf. delphinae)]
MTDRTETLAIVRRAVRSVIEATPALKQHPALSRQVANRMVNVSMAAAELIATEQALDRTITARREQRQAAPLLARAQQASDIHGRSAVRSAAGTVEALKNAIDFPGFVTSLINGVFQSIQNSNIQQLQSFADLLEAVNTSSAEFGAQQIGPAQAAQWAASRFPGMSVELGDDDEAELILSDEADLPERSVLQATLEAGSEEVDNIDDSDLTTTLLPLVQRKLARDRQSLLSTMIMMGLQRVVVDDGHLQASMRLQVDARSIAEQSQLDSVDSRIITEAGGSFGVGAWGASAKMTANVGFVHSDERYSREDIAASAGLRSSVNLRFRTLPLDVSRMAGDRSLQQIQSQTMVPERERELGSLLGNTPTRATAQPTRPDTSAATQRAHQANRQVERAEEARRRANQGDSGSGARARPAPAEQTSDRQTTERPAADSRSASGGGAEERPAASGRTASGGGAEERPAASAAAATPAAGAMTHRLSNPAGAISGQTAAP